MKSPRIVTTAGAGRPLFLGGIVFLLLCISSALAQTPHRPHTKTGPNGEFVPGRILVKFNNEVPADQAHDALAAQQTQCAGEIVGIGVHIVELPAGAVEAAYIHAFQQRPDVEFAELDSVLAPQGLTPNDSLYGSQWSLPIISASDAWSVTTGNSGIKIAIIDTGVDGGHPDLSVKFTPGWNIYDNNALAGDVNGHGTRMAGVVAAATNNSAGVAGICWACPFVPVRVSDLAGNATLSNIAAGITWAANNGIKIALVGYSVSTSSAVTSAAQYFQSRGGVVVAPSGNESTTGSFDSSPDNPSIITVSATDRFDNLAFFSNTGNNIDLAAPGGAYTTVMGVGYASISGTSIAAAHVAGVAALVFSANGSLTPAQVDSILKQSADDKGAVGWDSTFGWGRLNAARAVGMACGSGCRTNTTTSLLSSLSPSAFGQAVTFTATVLPLAATGTVTFSDGAATLGTGAMVNGIATFSTSNLSGGSHSITASYGGDNSYNGSTSPALTQTVNKAATTTAVTSSLNPSTSGQSVTFTATVSPTSTTGSVTFFDGATSLGTVALNSGTALLSTSSLSVAPHSITATYGGNGNYNGSTSPILTQTVNQGGKTNTTTTITSNLSVATVTGQGYSVAFSVTAASGTPTGTVTVSDGATTCLAALPATSCTLTSTAAGAKTIVATYSGDSNFNGSTSAGVAHTVSKASTTTTITSNLSTATAVNQAYTVAFSLTVNSPGSGTPTGTVTVSDGTNGCQTTLPTSSCTLISTTSGNKTITATYNGDGNFLGSVSPGVAHTVTLSGDTTPPTVSITAPANGATVSGSAFSVNASASDNVGVTKVEFYLDGLLQFTDTTSPYSWNWNTTTATNGPHSLTAKAYDAANNSTPSLAVGVTVSNVVPDTTPPTVGFTSPAAGSSWKKGTSVPVTITASDNVGVVRVEFYADGTLTTTWTAGPYSTSWAAPTKPGSHTLQAKAYDAAGNVGTVTESITLTAK